MKDILADLKMYGRFAMGLRGFFRQRISVEEAQEIVRQRMAERENNFLHLMEKGIFGYPNSPYRPLLELAGELWKQAKTLRIRRQEPIMTARGKFMPLCRTKLSQ